jgi:hypothetical protein
LEALVVQARKKFNVQFDFAMNRSTLESPSATGEYTPACSALLLLFVPLEDEEGLPTPLLLFVFTKTFANSEAPKANAIIIAIPKTIPNRVCFRNVLFECEKSFLLLPMLFFPLMLL